eukprot:CAMPEP_0176475716 /NCGR_PEP_ID=MMETSP0127-20121128/43756_1 /TAXON_ID=938130 /ORGANISM="Platyophrya macrostoma, Strain WH" /LENGTH=189 /DNA_ID=CAMNT_0017871333 /DNA_START=44 /DNA_END=610 /DNA_ORIENTATION=-
MNNFNCLFRFIIVGDTFVGKSCLLTQFTDHTFKNDFEATIGVDFASKTITVREKKVKLQIWDTAGQESFKSVTRSYYRGAIGALLLYDITRQDSFKNVEMWLKETRSHASEKMSIVLVGNKSDLSSKRAVSYEEGAKYAQEHGLAFFETSAKEGTNVQEVFYHAAEMVLGKMENGEIDPVEDQGIKMNK